MIQWQEKDLQVNTVRLHTYRGGSGRIPVVFTHGFTDNGLYYTRIAEVLAEDYGIVLYDGRGHGRSGRGQGRFTPEARVADLLGVIESLGVERPGLIGHSLGAATSALLAAQRPDLPRWLILEDPAWWVPPPDLSVDQAVLDRERAEYIGEWRMLVEHLQSLPYDEALQLRQSQHPLWSDMDTRRSLDARRQFEVDLFDDFPEARSPWREVVSAIRCPLLLLTGETEQGGIITDEIAQEVLRLTPHGRWAKIDGAGHSIRFDRFEDYLKAVREFLSVIED